MGAHVPRPGLTSCGIQGLSATCPRWVGNRPSKARPCRDLSAEPRPGRRHPRKRGNRPRGSVCQGRLCVCPIPNHPHGRSNGRTGTEEGPRYPARWWLLPVCSSACVLPTCLGVEGCYQGQSCPAGRLLRVDAVKVRQTRGALRRPTASGLRRPRQFSTVVDNSGRPELRATRGLRRPVRRPGRGEGDRHPLKPVSNACASSSPGT